MSCVCLGDIVRMKNIFRNLSNMLHILQQRVWYKEPTAVSTNRHGVHPHRIAHFFRYRVITPEKCELMPPPKHQVYDEHSNQWLCRYVEFVF